MVYVYDSYTTELQRYCMFQNVQSSHCSSNSRNSFLRGCKPPHYGIQRILNFNQPEGLPPSSLQRNWSPNSQCSKYQTIVKSNHLTWFNIRHVNTWPKWAKTWAMTRLKWIFFLDQVLFSQFQKCKRVGNVDIRTTPNKCLTKISKISNITILVRANLGQKRPNINICATIGPFLVRTSFHGIPGYHHRRFVFPAGGHIDSQLPWSFEQNGMNHRTPAKKMSHREIKTCLPAYTHVVTSLLTAPTVTCPR